MGRTVDWNRSLGGEGVRGYNFRSNHEHQKGAEMPSSGGSIIDNMDGAMSANAILEKLRSSGYPMDDSIARELLELHNSGKDSFFELVDSDAFNSLSIQEFFSIQFKINALLPNLEGSAEQLVEFTSKLVAKGGADLVASQPNIALRTWFANRKPAAVMAINAALRDAGPVRDHLDFVLEGLADEKTCWDLANSEEVKIRQAALIALGRGQFTLVGTPNAIPTLKSLLDGNLDDLLLAGLIPVLVRLVAVAPQHEVLLAQILRTPAQQFGGMAHFALAGEMAHEVMITRPAIFAGALKQLLNVNPEYNGVLQQIEFSLGGELLQENFFAVTEFVRDYLIRHGMRGPSSLLQGLIKRLSACPKRFGYLVGDWLGRAAIEDSFPLGRALARTLEDSTTRRVDLVDIELDPVQRMNLISRATGHFFFKPLVAAEIVVAASNGTTETEVHGLALHVLSETLLSNYAGNLREALELLVPSDDPHSVIARALDRAKAHLEAVNEVPELVEFRPSERRRQIAENLRGDELNRAHEEARNHSPLLSAISTSVLLYGSRSRSYRRLLGYEEGGELQHFEIEMRSFEHSMEIPRESIFDEIGLEQRLSALKRSGYRRL